MRILYFTHQYFPRHIGGTEIYTRSMVRRAASAGHQVMVTTCHESLIDNRKDFHVVRTVYETVPVSEIHFNLSVTDHPATNEYYNPFVSKIVQEQLSEFRPDLVHFMHAMKISCAPIELLQRKRIPVIATLCDFWFICANHTLLNDKGELCSGPDRPLKCVPCINRTHGFAEAPRSPGDLIPYMRDLLAIDKRLPTMKRALLKASRIFALSAFQKNVFVENGFPSNRIEFMTHGIELADLDTECTAEKTGAIRDCARRPLRIGYVGHLVPNKGVHVLIQALNMIEDQSVECLVYGPLRDDPYVDQLRLLAARTPSVRLMGEYEPSRLGQVLKGLDLLAMPVVCYENQPLVVKAAQHLGVPVLASKIGSLSEMIEDESWLVEAGSPQAWAAAIERLAKLPFIPRVSSRVKSMDDHASELFKVYESEVARKN